MRKLFFFMLISSLFLATSCKKESTTTLPTGNLELNIIAKYDGKPLVMNQTYTVPDGKPIRLQRFGFYLSNINDGRTYVKKPDYPLEKDIVWVDFTESNANEAAANAGKTVLIENVGTGDYEQVTCNIGVPSELNAKQPTDFKSSHVLSSEANYWEGWKSYIFAKLDGRLDIEGKGQFTVPFSYHTGSDASLRTLSFTKQFTITQNQTTRLTVEVDVKKVLDGVDILNNPNTHSLSELPLITKIMDNYVKAFKQL